MTMKYSMWRNGNVHTLLMRMWTGEAPWKTIQQIVTQI